MQKTRLTLVKNATSHSKPNEPSTHTTMPFMLRNPFRKQIDWLTVAILAALAGGAILFMLVLRLIAASV